MFAAFMDAIEQDNTKAPNAHAMHWQVRPPGLGGDPQHRLGAPDLPSNVQHPHPHPAEEEEEEEEDWFQVLSQNAHLVNLKSENPAPGFGFNNSELVHGQSMFYRPTRLFDVDASPGCR
jgi:hypothetical protein